MDGRFAVRALWSNGATAPNAASPTVRDDGSDAASNEAIRDRGRAIAAAGQGAVFADAHTRLTALEARLPGEPADRITVVAGGAMRLYDYLVTRIVT